MLNPEADVYRANDDGEPNHSAGDPILGQIKSLGLTNVLVVVIRYFGGTKLGVSGLITAYKTAALEALSQATIKSLQVQQEISIHFDYPSTNEVMKLIDKYGIKIQEQSFDINCSITATIPAKKMETFQKEAELLVSLGSKIELKTV
jgi:putative IMPACT (imprinted ancient) family translation regulator